MMQKKNINDITHTDKINSELKRYIQNYRPDKIFIITDSNCEKYCLPVLEDVFEKKTKVFALASGEQNKTIESTIKIWDFLFENEADRTSLVINLGGGIITDIGGFAASTFKRGVSFINIPTTLLSQVDASIGGKTGINYKGLKNQIGTIHPAEKIFISGEFLKTLPEEEFLSGFAEMLKHALIFDKNHFNELIFFIKNEYPKKKFENLNSLIKKSVNIKLHFVKKDPYEKNIRKVLNFGHTFGHAFESYFSYINKPVKHGIAVAHGIICDLILSVKKQNFPKNDFKMISEGILSIYQKIIIPENDFIKIKDIMKSDKKNKNNKIVTTIFNKTYNIDYEHYISEKDIEFTLNNYMNL